MVVALVCEASGECLGQRELLRLHLEAVVLEELWQQLRATWMKSLQRKT